MKLWFLMMWKYVESVESISYGNTVGIIEIRIKKRLNIEILHLDIFLDKLWIYK